MCEEEAVIIQQGGHRNKIKRNDEVNPSLLSIVHDKNKTIEALQKQLHFQKLQLKYYLGRTFKNAKMLEFSKSCNPLFIEENIPITLAVNRFCVQVGLKSKVVVLYERMCNIDGRINNLLHIQECLLRKMVGKVCEMVKKEGLHVLRIQIQKIVKQPEYIDLFNNLLNVNIGLKKNLDTFRICCDRLLIVEEERNSIAEQVYSLPVEQRTNCNYLISIQIEKVQLQNKLKDILKDQTVLRKKIEQLNEIEGELKHLQAEYKIANRRCNENMTDMLRRVNFEALNLIAKSNEQREKYTKEIVKLKCENQRILKMLRQLRTFVQEKEISKDSLRLDAVYSAGLYQALDKEITQAIQDSEMNKDSINQKIRNECKELSQKLQNFQNENSSLERELELLKTEYSEARRQWQSELESVQRDRDDYKAQVEDLHSIRAVYAQLVDSRANMVENVKTSAVGLNRGEKEYRGKGRELEQENLKLSTEVTELKEETNKQKAKIRRLSDIILNLNNGYNQKRLDIGKLETTDVFCGDVGRENDTLLAKTNSCNVCEENSKLENGIILQELQKSNVSQEDLCQLVNNQKLDEITSNILQDLADSSNQCGCRTFSCVPLKSNRDENFLYNPPQSDMNSSPEKSVINMASSKFPNRYAENTLKVKVPQEGTERDNASDSLERRKRVDEVLRKGNNSLVSVKVRYMSPKKIQNPAKMSRFEGSRFENVINETVSWKNRMLQSQALENLNSIPKKEKPISLKVTYRNTDCRTAKNSDQVTELQPCGIVNHDETLKREKKRLKDT